MKIWAHTLFKNEERWLWYAVTSVIDHVDRLLLWDTGSEDKSVGIAKILARTYKNKIDFREMGSVNVQSFAKVRQEMLDGTKSEWFLMVDADEIWWGDSIKKVIDTIKREGERIESVVVPTINLVGDIFHYQEEKAGRYQFGRKVGHYNLRAIKRDIDGLHSKGKHGIWGWADREGKQIQDRNTFKFIDAAYFHATFLARSKKDLDVPKRKKKLKYEIGKSFPLDFYYPEVFFKKRPGIVPSPWRKMGPAFYGRALLETPLRKIKRKLWWGRAGY